MFTSDSTTSPTVDVPELRQLKVFPNPSSGSVTVEFEDLSDSAAKLVVYDATGRIVCDVAHISSVVELYELPQGVLTIVLIRDSKQIAVQRVVVLSE